MAELEEQLIAADAAGARHKLIVTDGVFSMDGVVANLPAICDLADKYNALVMVDDSHAVGFMGANGRGTHEYHDVIDRIDIITGTLGKAMGGASGGYTSGKKEVIDWLRQRSRPYLFSNSVAPRLLLHLCACWTYYKRVAICVSAYGKTQRTSVLVWKRRVSLWAALITPSFPSC